MALARLGGARRPDSYTWPGFVDALATLLMVIIFVVLVFVLIQVNLAYRVSGQDATLNTMREQIASLGEMLNVERNQNADLSAELDRITSQLLIAEESRDDLSAQLVTVMATLQQREDALASAADALQDRNSEIARLNAEQAATSSDLAATREELEARLAALLAAQAELQQNAGRITDLEAETAASRAEVVQMANAMTALRQRLESLQALLADKEAQAARDKIAIASLGKSLNNALANRVQELQRFRSEFFGRLSEVLEGREDVQIVGDRFVFQSEVLFAQGQAAIGPEGQTQLAELAVVLNQIAADIPADIDWVLQVEGHTDDIPVRAGRFTDNWDLSTERALSVVRFLAERGLDANRLAAAGYGEFQPLDPSGNETARRRNRRIEIKLTQRISGSE
ncbi:MAG TPA: flagellar motor protein [Alphaproteobacteria bacterium]|jgi:chemotaxis protein MotB|nr:flagellar motor protein [Rhodospirillaceae bacterium]HAO58354.1 flagellar motor protein [Alphaproteobacteria bacterium]HBP72285.1 flagellar motor protein [Alphaproteobacteria bacterium]HCA14906.1 flagellar motor protein [Alphaproteobacteria bacterium]HCD21785.1 flagellar motor protein [Alphaproteobacteria bacterium]|tara:strand:- start:145 stop:1338 length:1194 start_codon:yes stop_codon:yes gene_type:complete